MKFTFIIEKTKTGYSAFEIKHPVYTTGKTILELRKNALEATNLFLEDAHEQVDVKNIHFEFDFKQFFEYYKIINAKHLAYRIGMNETLLSQYVNGRKRPSKKQMEKIINGLHEIGKELIEITLV